MQKTYHSYTLLMSNTDFYLIDTLTANARANTYAHVATHNYVM